MRKIKGVLALLGDIISHIFYLVVWLPFLLLMGYLTILWEMVKEWLDLDG